MSQCIHCDACKSHFISQSEFVMYCADSGLMEDESNTIVVLHFRKIHNYMNSDADTPTWCPRGLK